jgi:hypothetical protein
MKRLILLFAGLFLAVSAVACGDDPFRIAWPGVPTESTIFSLDREELNRAAGFNMLERRPVVVEAPGAEGRWDFALDREEGALVLLPPQRLGVESRAGISPVQGASWEDVREAPRDSLAFVTEASVPLAAGTVYIIRTHTQLDFFGRQCVFYGKMEVVEMDGDAGVLRFLHDTNPDCNNRRLVPRDG